MNALTKTNTRRLILPDSEINLKALVIKTM